MHETHHDGLGRVAHVGARLVSSGVSDPLDMPLDQAFVRITGMAANEGSEYAGEDYRDR